MARFRRLSLRDWLAVFGVVSLISGVSLVAGVGYALMALGGVLIASAALSFLASPRRQEE